MSPTPMPANAALLCPLLTHRHTAGGSWGREVKGWWFWGNRRVCCTSTFRWSCTWYWHSAVMQAGPIRPAWQAETQSQTRPDTSHRKTALKQEPTHLHVKERETQEITNTVWLFYIIEQLCMISNRDICHLNSWNKWDVMRQAPSPVVCLGYS